MPPQPFPHPSGQQPYNLTNVLGHLTTWNSVWTWRRSFSGATSCEDSNGSNGVICGHTKFAPRIGDISQQNWIHGNDYADGYLFLSEKETKEQIQDWYGGVNITALKSAEDRAYGWYWWYKHNAAKNMTDHLSIDLETAGTRTGTFCFQFHMLSFCQHLKNPNNQLD